MVIGDMNDQPKMTPSDVVGNLRLWGKEYAGSAVSPTLFRGAVTIIDLERDLAEAREQLAAERALADRMAGALESAEPLAIACADFYSAIKHYGAGVIHPVHERILGGIAKSLAAHRAARGKEQR
jgi:hypothetical protein